MRWITIDVEGSTPVDAVILRPPTTASAVLVYAHEKDGTLEADGNDLRLLARSGSAVISWDYGAPDPIRYAKEYGAVRAYLHEQGWAKGCAIAWVGDRTGADLLQATVRSYPAWAPGAAVWFNPGRHPVPMMPFFPSWTISSDLSFGRNVAPPTASIAWIIHESGPSLEPARRSLLKGAGEFCTRETGAVTIPRSSRSQVAWVPAAGIAVLVAIGGVGWLVRHSAGRQLTRMEKLAWVAAFLGMAAVGAVVVRTAWLPFASVTPATTELARRQSINSDVGESLSWLADNFSWSRSTLGTLLEHANLAVYNRRQVSWQCTDDDFRQFVLSPSIGGHENVGPWRRALWEEFYPHVRRCSSPTEAAGLLVHRLRERISVEARSVPRDVAESWSLRSTDAAGFDALYVAALRSIGIPARLASYDAAEILVQDRWCPAPRPILLEAPAS